MTVFFSLLPIVSLLVMGYVIGRFMSEKWVKLAGKSIGYLVWAILLFIGMEFGRLFEMPNLAMKIVGVASIYALATTLVACLLVLLFLKFETKTKHSETRGKVSFLAPVKEASIALLMVALGALCVWFFPYLSIVVEEYNVATMLLYALIFFVGIDLVGVKLDKSWYSFEILMIPVLVIIGSLIGGVISMTIIGDSLSTSLAISSGFGWFTLSSVMISDELGAEYGAIALMTDLFRELTAIVFMYLFAHRFPRTTIASGGATTLDTTLPIIKQTCPQRNVPLALFSGFILTIAAPIFMTFFLSL